MDKVVADFLAGNHIPEIKPHSSMLEVYKETPILFRWILRRMWLSWLHGNFQGAQGPVVLDSEALQGWLLKLGMTEKLRISVETFGDWLANQIPPWAAHQAFMSIYLIALDKSRAYVGVEETW